MFKGWAIPQDIRPKKHNVPIIKTLDGEERSTFHNLAS